MCRWATSERRPKKSLRGSPAPARRTILPVLDACPGQPIGSVPPTTGERSVTASRSGWQLGPPPPRRRRLQPERRCHRNISRSSRCGAPVGALVANRWVTDHRSDGTARLHKSGWNRCPRRDRSQSPSGGRAGTGEAHSRPDRSSQRVNNVRAAVRCSAVSSSLRSCADHRLSVPETGSGGFTVPPLTIRMSCTASSTSS